MTEHSHADGEAHEHEEENQAPEYHVPPEVLLNASANEIAQLNVINFELRTKVDFLSRVVESLSMQLSGDLEIPTDVE